MNFRMRTGREIPWTSYIRRNLDIAGMIAFVFVVAIIIIPISTGLLDLLLTFNITAGLVILLTTLFTRETRQLHIFPSALLATTLFRLALNISSTRLILSEANAGKVILAFGQFVVGGNMVVGMVIFLIITVVQFVVITNGAGRIAEVAARFTLDALPGKQMSIDADFNAGLIDETEARLRRKELQQEADFFGAMDGASKFVRGDAIVGIVIVLINIVGGLAIGVLQRGMDLAGAAQIYTILTVGDGLVAQVPALLISTAAGMLVTRSTAEASFGEELTGQFFSFPKVIILAAVLLFFLGLVPGLPEMPFFILAGAFGMIAFTLTREQKRKALEPEEEKKPAVQEPEDYRQILKVELFEIEIGYSLVPLTDETAGGNLLERITAARRRAIKELGLIIQPIRLRDNLHLAPNEYLFKLKGNEIARNEVRPGMFLALNPEGELPDSLEGLPTREPTFDLPALWLDADQKNHAEILGLTVVDAPTVLVTHLLETVRNNAHELLSRQTVQEMLQIIKENQPAVIEELVPEIMTLGAIQKVLQNLLRERVPLHDLGTILEELADQARTIKEVDHLTESVRQALCRTITGLYVDSSHRLKVITLDPALEQRLAGSLQSTRQGLFPILEPQVTRNLLDGLGRMVEKVTGKGIPPLVITAPGIRLPFRRLIERSFPQVAVLSVHEILPETAVEAVGVIREDAN